MPPLRRYYAPTGTGEVLADPGFDAVPTLVETNRRRLDRGDVVVGGLPLRELRALARREVYQSQSPPVATGGLSGPLLIAGHQPELSHPGVWVKHFALHGLARKLGGVGLNLVVDTDTLKSTMLRLPIFRDRDPAAVRLDALAFDRFDGETPYEDRRVADPHLFASLAERAAQLTRNWGYEPLLNRAWPEVVGHPPGIPIGERLAAVRTCFERKWGCENHELPVSRLAQTAAFAAFAGHILGDLGRFRTAYNGAVRAYRARHGIRSANHPAPDLAPGEAPFWVRTGIAGRRERATAESDPRRLRPRALSLTLFARLCLGDFFLHGIGGGKYDEVTDALIRDYFGIDPPAYQVLSATLHLPLPGFPATAADVDRAARLVRDLHWNPQRHLPPDAYDRPDVRALLAEKAALAAAEPTDRAARREWFRTLQAVTKRLRRFVRDRVGPAEAARARTEAEAAANAVLRRRDYAWVLYPEETLRPFLQQFLDQ